MQGLHDLVLAIFAVFRVNYRGKRAKKHCIFIVNKEVGAIRRTIRYILGMSEPAWAMTLGGLRLSAAFLLCAFIVLVEIGEPRTDTYYLYNSALEMARAPIPLIMFFGLAGLLLEDFRNSREK